MAGSNQHRLGILIFFSLGLFIIIIFIRIWFINYHQDKIIILRVVLGEVDDVFSELPGEEGVGIIVLLPHGRLIDGHPSPNPYFFHSRYLVFMV